MNFSIQRAKNHASPFHAYTPAFLDLPYVRIRWYSRLIYHLLLFFTECDQGFYGDRCSSPCTCISTGSSCNHITGECACTTPREGIVCDKSKFSLFVCFPYSQFMRMIKPLDPSLQLQIIQCIMYCFFQSGERCRCHDWGSVYIFNFLSVSRSWFEMA